MMRATPDSADHRAVTLRTLPFLPAFKAVRTTNVFARFPRTEIRPRALTFASPRKLQIKKCASVPDASRTLRTLGASGAVRVCTPL